MTTPASPQTSNHARPGSGVWARLAQSVAIRTSSKLAIVVV
ncbi:hypothetical protein [Verrucomicrobium spinosum]|nr:hypothetical protein [Verrucomicrobium spinosum]